MLKNDTRGFTNRPNDSLLVSVVIPIYKVEKYLDRCIESVLAQTYTNLEIILVDDGSPDRCPEICDGYAMRDDRITVIHKENGGLSSARNAGIEVMSGEYVTFLDSDDFLEGKAIGRWVGLAEEKNADLVIGRFADYYDGDNLSSYEITNYSEVWSSADAFRKMFVENDRLCTAWGKLYKVNLFQTERYPEEIRFAEDMFVIHKMFHNANKIVYDSNVSYYYNQEGESLVRSRFELCKLQRVDAIAEWVDFVCENYPALYETAFAYYGTVLVNTCMTLYMMQNPDVNCHLSMYLSYLREHCKKWIKNKHMNIKSKIKLTLLVKNRFFLLCKIISLKNTILVAAGGSRYGFSLQY